MSGQTQLPLFEEADRVGGLVVINGRCVLRTQDGHRVVAVGGLTLGHYAVGDRAAEALAMVNLVDQGLATQLEVARAFGCSVRTVRRCRVRFDDGGIGALGRPAGYPKGRPRVSSSRSKQVHRWKSAGVANREIARRLGVDEKAVRRLVRRLGFPGSPRRPTPLPLPFPADANPSARAAPVVAFAPAPDAPSSPDADANLSAPTGGRGENSRDARTEDADTNLSALPRAPASPAVAPTSSGVVSEPEMPAVVPAAVPTIEALPVSADTDAANRAGDRLLASLGLLDDAAPLFRNGTRVPGAGVLLALPFIDDSGVVDVARATWGSIGPAFYGLRTTVVALVLLALLRIKRPEALKERSPEDLGRILGLDRAPEVKTLRRKLARLAGLGLAVDFGRALAARRVEQRGASLGFLYVDGHVRVYHGKHRLPKAHVARMRIAMSATTDYWVNDAAGDPLLVLTAEANAGLARMLPTVLQEVRSLVGERRVTVVFDRGGFSPRLFASMLDANFDVLTYRKGRSPRVQRRFFTRCVGDVDGRHIEYDLADREVVVGRERLKLRQVTRRSDDGHQTPILTSRRDLSALEVATRMFDRWRQENFFKYLRDEYALDHLVEHDVVPDNPARTVPNPVRVDLDARLKLARAELDRLRADYGARAFSNPEARRPTMGGFKIAHGDLRHAVRAAVAKVDDLEERRARAPTRVPVADVVQGEVVKLAPERQHLASLFKMVAYQVESDLVRALEPHDKRVDDEGRTLIQTALAAPADIEVQGGELRIRLAPLSAPHRSRAVAALCDHLTRAAVCFPGTRLRVRYSVDGVPSSA